MSNRREFLKGAALFAAATTAALIKTLDAEAGDVTLRNSLSWSIRRQLHHGNRLK